MPDSKISSLTELGEAPASTDEFVIVDKSDTTMAATGTTKRIKSQYVKPSEITAASSASSTKFDFFEDTDNGTNKITVQAPAAVASDKTITLPDATDTLVGKDTTDTLTNKTLTAPVINGAMSGDAKATGATINTGTADDEFVTPKSIDDSYLSNVYAGVSRQAIINGNFDIWQRGTSATGVSTSQYLPDRFQYVASSDAVVSLLQSSDVPTINESGTLSNYSFHVDVTTADASLSASQFAGIIQRIEGFNSKTFGFGKSGTRYVTLSFWVKATKTGTYCVSFRNGASDRSYISEYTVSSANTWEKKTITIPVDTSGTWLYDNGIGMSVFFVMACGSTYQSTSGSWLAGNYFCTSNQVNGLDSASNDFRIAQVQLCAGDVALPFQPKSYDEELRACQRYFQFATALNGKFTTTTNVSVAGPLIVPMRATPTSALVGTPTIHEVGVAFRNISAIAGTSFSNEGGYIDLTVAAGTAGNYCHLSRSTFSSSAYISFSSEL